jgi:hypothetical protein
MGAITVVDLTKPFFPKLFIILPLLASILYILLPMGKNIISLLIFSSYSATIPLLDG